MGMRPLKAKLFEDLYYIKNRITIVPFKPYTSFGSFGRHSRHHPLSGGCFFQHQLTHECIWGSAAAAKEEDR
ncbi:hypothetical protein L2E82_13821 [Cichorium intybus]|uniref:Uncharacterized protein n=1 Tax=Cichorium intybus TaxID=13427 RepID=A0ACB9EXQ0_CICIN|nr:hypothetical protein L1887_33463 [Cichorium endivia]KAI3763824.1 hypothetical protein L2E82_13821 [Cichorium intybus]